MTSEATWEEIVVLGCEGGQIEITGTRTDTGWVFDGVSYSLNLDEDNEEVVDVGGVRGRTNLEQVLPRRWFQLYPIWVHDEFVDWFRQRFEAESKALLQRGWEVFHESAWNSMLNSEQYREDIRENRRWLNER